LCQIFGQPWLVTYTILIPFEVLGEDYKRHLPRNFETIGDIISWTYSSGLLNGGAFDEPHNLSMPDTPLDVEITGCHSQKWSMEARLRLANKNYAFGMYKLSVNPNACCLGIDVVDSDQVKIVPEPEPLSTGASLLLLIPGTARQHMQRSWSLEEGQEEKVYKASGSSAFTFLMNIPPDATVDGATVDEGATSHEKQV
jgi:hypothetical protein